MRQANHLLDGKFYGDVIRVLERFWTLPEMQQKMDRLAHVFWSLYEEIRIRQQEDRFEASFRLEENLPPDAEEDEVPDEDLILPPEDAIYAFLEEKNWEPLLPDDDRPISRARREKTVYDCLDEQYLGTCGKKPEEKSLGMFRFTEDGECLVIHGDKWNAIAWELEQLYNSPPAPRALMS